MNHRVFWRTFTTTTAVGYTVYTFFAAVSDRQSFILFLLLAAAFALFAAYVWRVTRDWK